MATPEGKELARWEEARRVIELHQKSNKGGDCTAEALKDWDTNGRQRFHTWLWQSSKRLLESEESSKRTISSMTTTEYIKVLESIDFHHLMSIDNFVLKTQIREPYPEPIIIGVENDYQYAIQSEQVNVDMQPPLFAEGQSHEYIVEPSGQGSEIPPCQYLLPLGPLVCLPTSDSKSKSEPTSLFFGLNTADKSLWLILGTKYYDDLQTDAWDFLPTAADGRPSFDVIRVMSWDELLDLRAGTIDGRHWQIFDDGALGTATRIHPQVHPTSEAAIGEVLRSSNQTASAKSARITYSG